MHSKTILVDFDGVLHAYASPWQGADVISDAPVPDAIQWLERMLQDPRFSVCIYSARSIVPAGIEAMKKWFLKHGLFDSYVEKLQFPTEKPVAFLTIDDRAFCFQGTFPDPDEIVAFKPWNKR